MTQLQIEKSTYYKHLTYSLIDGTVKGAFILNQFLFIKSLNGSELQLGILFQVSMVVFLLAVLFNGIIKRSKNKGRLVRITALLTRLPLLLFLFFPREYSEELPALYHYTFLGVFLVFYMAQPIILPVISLVLKQNYSDNNFGYYFGNATTASKAMMLISTFLFGMWLDADAMAFVTIYPVLGALSICSFLLISTIPYTDSKVVDISIWDSMKESLSRFRAILKDNVPFRQLEIGFMLYGLAWMATEAVITIFYEQVLDLNYSSVSFYKNAYNILAILLLPFFGKLIGKMDPRKFGVICFGSLLLYILFTSLTEFFPQHIELEFQGIKIYYVLVVATIFNGLFQATMPLLWGIGSSYFCKREEAGEYQAVHLSMVGVRASVFPLLGIYFLNQIGFAATYGIGIVSLLAAMLLMVVSVKRHKLL